MNSSSEKHIRQRVLSALELLGILLLALVLRAGYIEQSGFTVDLLDIEEFGRATLDGGLLGVYARPPQQDYPPLPLVPLWAGFSAQKAISRLSTMTVLKALPVAGDIALIVLAYVVFRRRRWGLRLGIPLTLAVLPGVIATSAFWGQFDSAWTACVVLSAYLLKRSRFSLAWSVFALGMLIKPQVIVLAPVLGMFTLLLRGWRGVLRGGLAMSLTFALILLPFVVGSGLQETLRPFQSSVGRFPFLTLNALNLWLIFTASTGLSLEAPDYPMLPDNVPLSGLLTGYQIGLLLLGLYTLLVVIMVIRQRNRERVFVWTGALYLAFFMLATQMHERYVYPAAILALFAIAEDRRMVWVAVPLAVTFSYNIIAITSMPFVWFGVNLWYVIGEAGLFAAVVNGLILVLWTWFLLTPEPLVRPRARRAEKWLKAALAASFAGLVVYAALPEPLPQMNALDAHFDNGARLLGYEISSGEHTITVDLFWASTEPIPVDLAVFAHAMAGGERIASDGGPPAVPSTRWALNEVVTTRHVLDIGSLNPETVSVVAGMYNAALEPSPATQDGAPAQGDLIALGMGQG